ncbi:MAG: efflux RND transporter permease subunit [Rickettsiales bacterium]|nr:efflux RND transporter permease subunit [Rickettsiales bacterium]
MILTDISVKRPVFATVIAMMMIAFGLLSFDRLALREYPNIDPPVVTVEVTYPGAPANIVETRITEIVEERIAGIEAIEFIESESLDGESRVTIEFSVARDIDAAANDVRDRIAGIQDDLPNEADPPEVQKVDSNDDVIIWQNLVSTEMTVPELTDYAERYLVDQYSTLDGVARVRVGGALRYAMRIWLDRQEMAARNLSVSDIEMALRAQNIELPAGNLESADRMFKARVDRNFKKPDDFAGLVLAQGDDNYLIRLGDVARVELGVEEDRTFFRGNGVPMVGIGIIKQSNANTIDVARSVKKLTEKLNGNLPKGMSIKQSYDSSVFIEASINEVYKTLLIAMLCVIAVIYLFLGSVRAMLIPAVTVPISIVATFSVLLVLGFSINLLTLLALVLAIGLVVDDAIVMLENIVRRMEEYNEPPLVAAFYGARQVSFAVVATTLVLIAVFVPITFLEGDVGRLFTEFALTMAAAVCFSSILALSLSPMMASQILKKKSSKAPQSSAVQWVSTKLESGRCVYLRKLESLMQAPSTVAFLFVGLFAITALLYTLVPEEFVPKEDRGVFFIIVNGPEGATYDYMKDYMDEIESRLMPYVEDGAFKRLLVRAPRAFGNIETFNTGIVIVIMEDWSERKPAHVILGEIGKSLSELPGVRAFPVMRQALGGAPEKPLQFVIGGSTYEELAAWRDVLFEKINADNPGLQGLDSDYKETRPQIDFQVNYDRAASLGVTIEEIGRTMETMMGGRDVTTFLDRGEEYEVIIEGERSEQRSFNDIENIYIRSERTARLIPLANLVDIREYAAAQTLARYNRVRSLTIEANLEPGLRLGDALEHLNGLVDEHLPDYTIVDYKGESRDYVSSGSSIIFVFIMGLVIVFLVLAAQFESYIHPLIIMLTVPLAMGGGLLGLYITGNSLNIYSQIGLIMLVGLAAKNGILIVEFANQLRDEGIEFKEALFEAASTRFRPIVMTGLTTVAGAVPLVLASGAGAETRIVIGVVVLTGVFAATFFTLFFIPVAYQVLAQHTGSPNVVARRLEAEEKAHKKTSSD